VSVSASPQEHPSTLLLYPWIPFVSVIRESPSFMGSEELCPGVQQNSGLDARYFRGFPSNKNK
jgi:hypothetical protein